eukprot:912716-Pyramimonas_sp.AAC.1
MLHQLVAIHGRHQRRHCVLGQRSDMRKAVLKQAALPRLRQTRQEALQNLQREVGVRPTNGLKDCAGVLENVMPGHISLDCGKVRGALAPLVVRKPQSIAIIELDPACISEERSALLEHVDIWPPG